MKKLLLLSVATFLYSLCFSQVDIFGDRTIRQEGSAYYELYSSDTIPIKTVTWEVENTVLEKIGENTYPNRATLLVTTKPSAPMGITYIYATVRYVDNWYEYPMITAFVAPKYFDQVTGPPDIMEGQEVSYSVKSEYKICDMAWNFDSNHFSIISGGSKSDTFIKLKAKKKGITTVKVGFHNPLDGSYIDGSSLSIEIVEPFNIIANNLIVCNGENISFSLEGKETPELITWEAVSNCSLISGQNTRIPTFKVSGNGIAKVKAIVKFKGKDYPRENSDVWVGAPAKPLGIVGIPTTGIKINSIYNLTVKPAGGAENYYWNPLAGEGKPGYPTLVRENTMATLHTGSNSNLLNIMLSVRAENKCGISAFYILPITGSSSGGPSPFMLKSNNSFDESLQDIKIYTFTTGQTVYQEKKAVNFNIENTTLKSGIYIIESTDESGNITRTKVMKK